MLVVAIVAAGIMFGGGVYYFKHHNITQPVEMQSEDTQTSLSSDSARAPIQTSSNSAAGTQSGAGFLTFTSPTKDKVISVNSTSNVSWSPVSIALQSKFKGFAMKFLIVNSKNEVVVSLGDGDQLNSTSFKLDSYLKGNVDNFKAGEKYRIKADLGYFSPQGLSIGCDPNVKGECVPLYSDATNKLIQESKNYISYSPEFTVDTTGFVKNNPPVIASLTGPIALRAGEKGTWALVATDDTATTLRYSCNVGLWTELSGPNGVPFMGSSGGGSFLPDQTAAVGASVLFEYTPTKPTTGKEYYNLTCNVIEQISSSQELSARYQKDLHFTVSN